MSYLIPHSSFLCLAATLLLGGLCAAPALAVERISVSSNNAQGGSQSRYPAISADGRYVAFVSDATNLVAGDTNGAPDVFLRDRLLGTTVRISNKSDGSQSNGISFAPSISGDGRRIVFSSYGSLLPNSGWRNCYLYDRSNGSLQILDLKPDGGAGTFGCDDPTIDLAGRRVAFTSRDLLAAGDNNGYSDIFVRDLASTTSRRISLAPGGGDGNLSSSDARISADGSRVIFASSASNLVAGDSNGIVDVFLAAFDNSVPITRVNVGPAGTQANGFSEYDGALNANGSLLAFASRASSLPDWGEFAETTMYLRIPSSDATIALSIPAGNLMRESTNMDPDFDYTGRYLVFASGDVQYPGSEPGVYVVDLLNGLIALVSVGGESGNVYQPRISADGTGVVWYSYSAIQVPNDTNGTWDVFYAENPLWTEMALFADGFE